jgi:hypothetical protein
MTEKQIKALKNRGLHSKRLLDEQENPREEAFALEWEKQNKGMPVGDYATVQRLAGTVTLAGTEQASVFYATVIQWLGSNVGFDFLRIALDKCGYDIVPKRTKAPK